MQNMEVAKLFDEYADILEIQGANPFRVRAYRNAARMIGDLPESIAEKRVIMAVVSMPVDEARMNAAQGEIDVI